MVCWVIYPRALPPVTQGSAFQAPERIRGSGDVITFQAPECLWLIFLPRIIRIGRIGRIYGAW